MGNNSVSAIAEAYYIAMGQKDIEGVSKYLHPDVSFRAPLAQTQGKAAFLEATKGFMNLFKTTTIRATLGSGDQAAVIYDVDFPAPIGVMHSAAFLTIQEGLISKIELFYDARPFDRMK